MVLSTWAAESDYPNISAYGTLLTEGVRVVSVASSHVLENIASGKGMFPDPNLFSSPVVQYYYPPMGLPGMAGFDVGWMTG